MFDKEKFYKETSEGFKKKKNKKNLKEFAKVI